MSATPRTDATIVITTRNRPDMARHALQTALAQTLPPVAVVVVDDGSDPAFRLDGADPRVTLVRLVRSAGVSAARNAGLARATSEWVTFLDDDDELVPEMLEVSLRAAAASTLPPPISVLSGVETTGRDGAVLTTRFPRSLARGHDYFLEGAPVTVGNSLVVPSRLLESLGGFDEELRSAEHGEMLLRLNAVSSIEAVRAVTYRIRRHEGVHVHSDPLARATAMRRIERTHRAAFERHRGEHAAYLSSTGVWYLKAGRWREAVGCGTRGLLRAPASPRAILLWVVCLGGRMSLLLYRLYRRTIRSLRRS